MNFISDAAGFNQNQWRLFFQYDASETTYHVMFSLIWLT
ncbi:hypothetical protein D083_0160 [Dickeya solani RNS 08.23.3.1.A]|nr:hypothetical protein D083_0160 [Dickeya solani RNS 08.23.3.1.A]